jgi:hypothetical protein
MAGCSNGKWIFSIGQGNLTMVPDALTSRLSERYYMGDGRRIYFIYKIKDGITAPYIEFVPRQNRPEMLQLHHLSGHSKIRPLRMRLCNLIILKLDNGFWYAMKSQRNLNASGLVLTRFSKE